jgi:Type IV pilin-like G and H, putative
VKGLFARKMDGFDIRISPNFYRYTITQANQQQSIVKAVPNSKGLKSYAAAVATHGVPANSSSYQFYQIICESNEPGFTVANPKFNGMKWTCSKKI